MLLPEDTLEAKHEEIGQELEQRFREHRDRNYEDT